MMDQQNLKTLFTSMATPYSPGFTRPRISRRRP
jgi:hypothetical protein